MPASIVLPSGLSGIIRAIQVEDANKLGDSSLLYDLRHILRDAFTPTDLGIYKAPFDWTSVYQSDRFVAMLECSILTHRDIYRFRYPCRNPAGACRHKEGGDRPHPIPYAMNLSKLARRPLPETTRQKLAAGDNSFVVRAIFGQDWSEQERDVTIRFLDEKTEVEIASKLESGTGRKKRARTQIAAMVTAVSGVDPSTLNRYLDVVNDGHVQELREKIDELDGGINTEILISCDRCGWEELIELPLGGLFRKRLKFTKAEASEEAPAAAASSPSPAPSSSDG